MDFKKTNFARSVIVIKWKRFVVDYELEGVISIGY